MEKWLLLLLWCCREDRDSYSILSLSPDSLYLKKLIGWMEKNQSQLKLQKNVSYLLVLFPLEATMWTIVEHQQEHQQLLHVSSSCWFITPGWTSGVTLGPDCSFLPALIVQAAPQQPTSFFWLIHTSGPLSGNQLEPPAFGCRRSCTF